jgi:FolB domain-containing protein
MPCRIEIADFELDVRIGCTPEEREAPQPIRIGACVRKNAPFAASRTDRLSDTVDAAEIKDRLGTRATESRVQTLERLGQVLEDDLRQAFPAQGLDWEVRVNKPRFGWSYVHAWSS